MEKRHVIPEKAKQIFCLILVIALIAGYALYHAVPWFDTFGKGYAYMGSIFASYTEYLAFPTHPDICLTLDGRFVDSELEKGVLVPVTQAWGFRRINLNWLTFDCLFKDKYAEKMEWVANIRKDCKAAWAGLAVNEYGVYLMYLLKQKDDSIYTFSMPLYVPYKDENVKLMTLNVGRQYILFGTTDDFYDFIREAIVFID